MLLAVSNNVTLNLEAIGIFLGILVSLTILLGVLIQYANKLSSLDHRLHFLQQELLEHSNSDGHKVFVDKLENATQNVYRVEKSLDLHIQDYVNRKDFIQFMLGQLDQKVDHKFERLHNAIKETEKFLQKTVGFKAREYFIDADESEKP